MKRFDQIGASPAPWFVDAEGGIGCYYISNTIRPNERRYRVVADPNFNFDECVSDARLIAAAPKLYSRLLEAIEDKCCFCSVDEDKKRELCDLCIVAEWKEVLAEAAGDCDKKGETK